MVPLHCNGPSGQKVISILLCWRFMKTKAMHKRYILLFPAMLFEFNLIACLENCGASFQLTQPRIYSDTTTIFVLFLLRLPPHHLAHRLLHVFECLQVMTIFAGTWVDGCAVARLSKHVPNLVLLVAPRSTGFASVQSGCSQPIAQCFGTACVAKQIMLDRSTRLSQ
jgi:fumarate reductase subunit D